jgi:Glycosyl hydrolases family 39
MHSRLRTLVAAAASWPLAVLSAAASWPLAVLLAACFTGGASPEQPDGGARADAAVAVGSGDAAVGDAVVLGDAAGSRATVVSGATPTVVISGDQAVTAPPTGYGQNYWVWVTQWGDSVHPVQSSVAAMHLNVLRGGGHNNDTNVPEVFTNDQVDKFVAYAQAIGATPILQVPLLKDQNGARPTPATAAAFVTYANVTKGYGIKYWEIGNEPDLYSDQGDLPGYTAANYCTDFAAFADAMRAADPTIKILGPELSNKYVPGNDWLTPFLTGCGSKVDIVSVHRYPFSAVQCTIPAAMNDPAQFRAVVRRLRQTMNGLGLSSIPLAITEANLSYEGDPALQTGPAALGTFYAGMWVADVSGIALEENLWTLAYWSIDEAYTTGFFTSDTLQPRPAAYAYELLSTHFGPTILRATTVPSGLSVHASRDDVAKKTAVLFINRTALAMSPVAGFVKVAANPPSIAIDMPAYSIALVEIHDDGSAPVTWLYTKDMADQNGAPQML